MDIKKVYGNTLVKLLQKYPDMMVVDADLMRLTGTNPVHDNYPQSYVNVGIAEQDLLGIAGGLAATGRLVFASAFCNFMAMRSCDQVSSLLCYNELNVKMCGTYAGITSGINGGTHISVSDIAIMRSLPGIRVADPGDGIELAAAMEAAAEVDGPVYIRMPKGPAPTVFPENHTFTWGKGVVLSNDGDITLVTSGITTAEGIKAVQTLKEEGISVRHIHMPSIKPIDEELLIDAAKKSKVMVTVENHSVVGGLGSAVAEVLSLKQPIPVIRYGVKDEFCEGITEDVLKERHDMSANQIAAHLKQLVK